METLVDGMIDLLQQNLVANSRMTTDLPSGSTVLYVKDTLRFNDGDEIILQDNTCVWDPSRGVYTGQEFHTIQAVLSSNALQLKYPTEKLFRVSDGARIQKAIRRVPLYPKDIYYGDREIVCWDYIAVCVEPTGNTPSWMAINGTMIDEWKMSIFVYVKVAGTGDANESLAQRTCNRYCDAIKRLLIGNIHLDLAIDDVPIMRDVSPGDTVVYIPSQYADAWPHDPRTRYEIQDNYTAEWDFYLPETAPESSSSSSSEHSSSSSWSSVTQSSSSSSSSESSSQLSTLSSSSSSSSYGSDVVAVTLSGPVHSYFRVRDKAVLRRNRRYMFDSLPSNIEYSMVQKGEYLLKAGRIDWFGKETKIVQFPQVGRGGHAYSPQKKQKE